MVFLHMIGEVHSRGLEKCMGLKEKSSKMKNFQYILIYQKSLNNLNAIRGNEGQTMPKKNKKKYGINSGNKFVVVNMEKNGKVCCLSLLKVGNMEPMVKGILGPIMK